MAYLVGCEQVELEFMASPVFTGLSLGVNSGDRIGVVGRNGDGKSSLLRVLSGEIEPDAGRVVRTKRVTIGVLGQRDSLDDAASVGDAVVGGRPEYEWAGSARVREILAHLVGDIAWDAQVGTLSGGQRRRVDLARVLIGDWDVLMLDEPTNHLDIEGIHWLAGHLQTRWRAGEGALLVVTHDRWFLDEVCLNMWEVHGGGVHPFEGGYSAYVQQRVERQRQAAASEARRQNILRRELAWLARGPKARGTKPKFRVDAALELVAQDPPLRDSIQLKRSAASRLGKKVINLKNVSVTLGGQQLVRDLDFNIGAGQRFAILGANGAGKTTMLRLICGQLAPTRGRVEIGETVKFAYLTQQLDELEALADDRVREVCLRYKTRYELADGSARSPLQLLEELGFEQAQFSCPVRDLSGGQKRRFQLMLTLLDQPNVLVLDEPGNDLDTDMLAQLETLLDTWPGTLILVSHDRYLVERVTDDQYALVGGQFIHMPRGVDQYLEWVAAQESPAQFSVGKGSEPAENEPLTCGFSQRELREMKKLRTSTERKMGTARSKLAAAKEALLEIDGTNYEALAAQQAKIDTLATELDELELTWLDLSEKLGD